MHNQKIVVAAVPYTATTAPIMAPALFKGILNNAGFECVGIDLNGIIYNLIADDPDKEDYLKFFYYELVSPGFELKIKNIFKRMADEIIQHSPTMVCLSLLHYQCQASAKWLSFLLKQIDPNLTIVIGGAGTFGHGMLTEQNEYISFLQKQKLVDYYISGDGDVALVELVKGNIHYPGINSMTWTPIEDLNHSAYPNYDDYDFNIYNSPFVGVLGSRGCVRQCTFCDIHEYWEKFKWRTGENIFNEMLFQNQKYGIQYFKFQDSLINGNVKEYNTLISLLADHNKKNPANMLRWASYFIFRPATQMSEEQWKLTAESGAINLNVGIESVVEKNRNHIKKKFSNADIDFGLEMAKKYNIKLILLMIVGYVTETEEDHIESLKWLEDHAHYADTVKSISAGGTLAILPGTWLFRNQQSLGVTWIKGNLSTINGDNHLWKIESTGNNYEARVRRLLEFVNKAKEVGFTVETSVIDPQKELENIIKEEMLNANKI